MPESFSESSTSPLDLLKAELAAVEEQCMQLLQGKQKKLFDINPGSIDDRYYFYQNIPERIAGDVLQKRIRLVNQKTGTCFIATHIAAEQYPWDSLEAEEQRALLIFSQWELTNRFNELNTPSKIAQYYETMRQMRDKIDNIRTIIPRLIEETQKQETSGDKAEAIRKLAHYREGYHQLVACFEQQIRFLDSYQKHFERESRWRIIDGYSHIHEGRLFWFGEPVEGTWIYVITQDGDFNFGNRQSAAAGGYFERLPHATLSKGKKVYCSGEALFVQGRVHKFNGVSGHYFDQQNPNEWNTQVNQTFGEIARHAGLTGDFMFVKESLQ